MTFEEKLDRVIVLLECLIEDRVKTTGFTHVKTTLDVPDSVDVGVISKYTHKDIRDIVVSKKNSGILAQDLKNTLNMLGYSAIADIPDRDIDNVYNSFLSL